MSKWIMSFLLAFLCNGLLATSTDSWNCTAYDQGSGQWTASSDYERSAINKAMELCKKSSQYPTTCKISKNDCDYLANGQSTRPMWQCKALDQMAKIWPSSYYTQRDDAAIAARSFCEEKSAFPDTCYVNLITCKNVNQVEY
ncbi:hypothetical protein ACFORL_00460 [Legionella dresdenensis]|uniref:DUF4189 domain-containing protein n=1 Tax=Legionella dresdenensis TaxID=450200 RepID=A0ABV8CB88_9GAMM